MRGNVDIMAVVSVFVFILIALPILSFVLSSFQNTTCQAWQEKVKTKDLELDSLRQQLTVCNERLALCQNEYETLVKTNLTKKDFEQLKGDFQVVQLKLDSVEKNVAVLQSNYFQSITNYAFIGSASFVFLAIELIDVALIAFNIEPKVDLRKRIGELIRKVGLDIKSNMAKLKKLVDADEEKPKQ